MKKHAKLAPSSAKRWMVCPASIKLCEGKKVESDYADEGTAAHALAEACLVKKVNASIFLGRKIPVKRDDGTVNYFVVTTEMIDAVTAYVDYCRTLFTEDDIKQLRKKVYIEKPFNLSWLDQDVFGTNDFACYSVRDKSLTIVDYKHGAGVPVSPYENPQLKIYALGAIWESWNENSEKTKTCLSALSQFEKVKLVIVQPRCFSETPIKEWELTASELFFWAFHVLKPACEATRIDEAILKAGEHCRFCSVIATCPEQIKNALTVANVEFSNPKFESINTLTPERISEVLKFSDAIYTWVKEVKSFAYETAKTGLKIPGWKLVQGKTHRKWIDETKASNFLVSKIGEDAWTKNLISPAQAEKILGKGSIDAHTHKPAGAFSLVEDCDFREEKTPTAIEFKDEPDFKI